MNHIRTYHYYWHIFFFSLLVCMTEFTKAADRGVLERVIYLAKSKGTVYTLLGKVSEQSGFLFVYDSKVVDNDRTVKLGAGQRTIRQVVYEIIGRQDISLRRKSRRPRLPPGRPPRPSLHPSLTARA